MVAVHARMLLASLPSRIFERQAGIGVPVGCTTELKVSWLGTPFLDRRNLSRKSRSALGQTSPHLLLSGRNLAALGPAQGGGGKMDGFDVRFAESKELPEIQNSIRYPSGHI
jgi:hypothetical protein